MNDEDVRWLAIREFIAYRREQGDTRRDIAERLGITERHITTLKVGSNLLWNSLSKRKGLRELAACIRYGDWPWPTRQSEFLKQSDRNRLIPSKMAKQFRVSEWPKL